MRRPFERVPFGDLPALPKRAHPYEQTAAREVSTRSERLGTLRIHYREAGSGPPLLLVHGLMTTSYSWRYVIEPLGRHYRLVIPDLPGCGRSEVAPPGGYGAASLAAWIGDFQRALGIEGCLAIGNSMGGYLTLRHALASPGAFARLVDIHSPAFPDAKLDLLAALLKVPGARALTAWLARRDPLRWAHRNVHYFDEELKSLEEAHAYGDPLATIEGSRAFACYLAETMAASDLRAFTAELRARFAERRGFPVPLMLLYADRDPLVSPRNGERLHALLPEAELSWITASSHFAHVDTPEQVVARVLPFLSAATATQPTQPA
jgi:pimeloyl-ACP methyl ester carboxylesterase